MTSLHKPKVATSVIKKETILFIVVFFIQLIAVMNTSMFNVALPNISGQFEINAKTASLMVSSYSIVFALCTILYSKLSSSIPIKILLSFGIILLSIGSFIGVFSTSFPLLIFARIIQALGASSISALSVIIATRYIPIHRRGKRLGQVSSAVTLGLGLGPLVGGIMTQFLGWEYLFIVSLLSLIGIPFYLLLLPLDKGLKEVFDYKGMFIFFVAIIVLLVGITHSWIYAPVAILIFILYFYHINRQDSPFMEPSLLKNKFYIKVIGIGFVVFFINFSMLFLLPFILVQSFNIENIALVGLILFPGALIASVLSIFIGRAVDRYGSEVVMLFGVFGMPTACILASLWGQTSIVFVVLVFTVSSSSFVCITTSLPNMLTKDLPENQMNTGIGTLHLIQFIGGGIGVTISGKLLTYFKEVFPAHNEYYFVFIALFLISLTATMIYLLFSNKARTISVQS